MFHSHKSILLMNQVRLPHTVYRQVFIVTDYSQLVHTQPIVVHTMRSATLLTAGTSLAASARAWQLPNNNLQHLQQHPFSALPTQDDDIDIVTGSQFNGLKTFANLPYVNALSDEEALENKYDIAIFGAPFDTSTSGRPGARFGPGGIRIGSQRMFPEAISVYTGEGTLNQWAKVVDCGDVGLTWFDNTVALRQLDKAHRVRLTGELEKLGAAILTDLKVISGRPASNSSISKTPRILTLGGDHTTTLSALRSTAGNWGDVSVVHFDSHIGE